MVSSYLLLEKSKGKKKYQYLVVYNYLLDKCTYAVLKINGCCKLKWNKTRVIVLVSVYNSFLFVVPHLETTDSVQKWHHAVVLRSFHFLFKNIVCYKYYKRDATLKWFIVIVMNQSKGKKEWINNISDPESRYVGTNPRYRVKANYVERVVIFYSTSTRFFVSALTSVSSFWLSTYWIWIT